RPDGTLVEEIPHHIKDSTVCDVFIGNDGAIYLLFFHTGRILRINKSNRLWHAEFLPHQFGTPGGSAMDSRGRLYVSNFGGDAIYVVYSRNYLAWTVAQRSSENAQ